jgi:hypothetical protein
LSLFRGCDERANLYNSVIAEVPEGCWMRRMQERGRPDKTKKYTIVRGN